MKAFSSSFKLLLSIAVGLSLASCGGPPVEEEEPKQAPPTAIVETLPTPPPVNKEELLSEYANRIKAEVVVVKAEAEKAGILPLIGQKITPEDLARFAAFFWAVDGNLRIAQLRSMAHYNRLIEVLKEGEPPPPGKAPSPDPDQDNPSFLISQTIDDAALVQRAVVEGLLSLGVKNVKGVSPSQELPTAPTMMQEILKLVKPAAPESAPETLKSPLTQTGVLKFLFREAQAQATRGKTPAAGKLSPGASSLLSKPAFPPLIKLKIVGAPLLLARALTYDVDGKFYVLRSPFKKAVPEFQAIPAEQFVLAAEKQSIGSEYRNALEARLNALAAVEGRTVSQWWEAANLMAELKWAYPLVDLAKEAVETQPSTLPSLPAATQPATLPSTPPPMTQPSLFPPASPPSGATLPPAEPPGGATLPPAPETKPAPSPAGIP